MQRRAGAVVFFAALVLITYFFAASAPPLRAEPAARVAFHGRDVLAENWNGDFTLADPDNQERSLREFRGKVVLLAFGYTHCPDVCPTTLAKFAQVRRLLGTQADRVQAIFVTIDPERDTAELLRNYVPAFDPSFLGLRGTEAQTDAVTRAYHANYQILDYRGSVLVDHTASTYVIDAQGRVRLVTPYDQSARELADDVAALLRSDG